MLTIGPKMVKYGYATDRHKRAESNTHIALGP